MIARSMFAAAALAAIFESAAMAQQLPPQANHPAVKEAASVCAPDISKYCSGVMPGGGRIVRCLASNEANITPDCKASILKAKAALGM